MSTLPDISKYVKFDPADIVIAVLKIEVMDLKTKSVKQL
jgi:hypothetical protein